MKLFVWDEEGTLQDYSTGLICVYANSIEEALRLIKEKCDYCVDEFDPIKYKVIEKPEAFICWGSS